MPILTVKEISQEYKVCHATVLNWIKKGLPATKIGKVVRIEQKDLEEFIAAQNTRDSSAHVGGDTEKGD